MNGPPPPYEAVTSEPAISASLITLLQPTEDSLRVSVPNLEDRLRLAFNLAFSLNLLHQRGVNHGKITSGNVVILRCSETTSQGNYRSWRGYDIRNAKFLPADESGRFSAPVDLEPYPSNIYHHPQAGQASSIRRKQAHDIYSLGLVLLEIGFWMPLRAFWKTKYSQDVFKSRLENVYVKKLAAKCGSVYMRTVQHCLASVDSLIVQPFQVITPSQIQRHFHVKVVKLLERYSSVLDEPDSLPVSDLSALPQPPEGESVQTPPIAQKRRPQKCLSKRKVKVWSIPPPASVLDDWNHLLLPRLERIVNRTLKNSAESFSADLMMVGENSVTLRPMIMVTCTSVLEIKTAIHRHLKHNRETYDLRVRRGEICRSKVSRKRKRHQPYRSAKPSATEMSTTQEPATLPSYQQQPACGASIGAFRDNEHLPPVSFGGVILLDDELYGMTVHHMLEQSSVDEDSYSEEDENEDPVWSNATSGSDSLFPETFPAHSSYGQNLPQALYQLEISDDEDDGYSSAADDDDGSWIFEEPEIDEQVGLDDDDVSLGDSPGIDPNEDDAGDCLITQPAIDDVDDAFFPIEDDRDEEHLASHFLGNIHASSGIRRWKRNGLKHEIDWALIKLIDSRAQHYNIIKGGGRYCGGKESGVSALEDFCPHRVASVDELAGLPVHCLGRTSGLQGGTISSAMSLVKFHGRSSPSLSWHVVGNFGGKCQDRLRNNWCFVNIMTVGGDSGAWVIDNRHGRVCGHVLAWCSKSCVAYIAPMEVLLEDITQTLQASRVALPCPRRLARTEAPAQSGRYDLTKTRIAMAVDKPLPAIPMSSLPLNWDAVDSTGSSQYTLVETASVTEPGSTDDIEHMQEPVGGRYKLESENDKKLRGGNIPMSSGPPSTPLVIASGKARAC